MKDIGLFVFIIYDVEISQYLMHFVIFLVPLESLLINFAWKTLLMGGNSNKNIEKVHFVIRVW